MRKHQIQTSFLIFDHAEELPPKEKELLALAKKALDNSHSPYSNFKVGAAVLLENGATLGSSNYENAAYPLCVCAEHSALITAANRFPGVPVVTLAITILNPEKVVDQPALPCGGCRQVIHETELRNKQNIRLILQGETGPIYVFESGKEILPLAFGGEFL